MRQANRPILNADGYATGVVVKSELGQGIARRKGARDDIDEQTYDRYELTVQVEGKTGPIEMRIYTGTVLNPEPVATKGRGKKVVKTYNRLTTLCLGLGLVTADELASLTEEIVEGVERAFLNLEGDTVEFKVGLQDGLYLPDLGTLRRAAT